MSLLTRLSLCASLIILVSGTIHFVHSDPGFGESLVLLLVWGVICAIVISSKAFAPSSKTPKGSADLPDRVTLLEKRLADIQDIVLSIDDKLDRPIHSHRERTV